MSMTDNCNPLGSEHAVIPSNINSTSAHSENCESFTGNSEFNPDNPDEYPSQIFPQNSSTNSNQPDK